MFPTQEVEGSEEDKPFIDLLSTIPRASGKVPVVKDEEENKIQEKASL